MNIKEATIKTLEAVVDEVRHCSTVATQGLASADACHEVSTDLVVKVEDLTKAVNSLSRSIGGFIDEVRGLQAHHGDRLNSLEKRVPSANDLQILELRAAKERQAWTKEEP
jgi:hypothetical protein